MINLVWFPLLVVSILLSSSQCLGLALSSLVLERLRLDELICIELLDVYLRWDKLVLVHSWMDVWKSVLHWFYRVVRIVPGGCFGNNLLNMTHVVIVFLETRQMPWFLILIPDCVNWLRIYESIIGLHFQFWIPILFLLFWRKNVCEIRVVRPLFIPQPFNFTLGLKNVIWIQIHIRWMFDDFVTTLQWLLPVYYILRMVDMS
jgi:hypothetical protein